MGIMDKVKQAVQGRSGMVEKGIDRAVGQVDKRTKGKYNDKLTKQATGLKARARRLDSSHTEQVVVEDPFDANRPGDVPPTP